MVSQRTFPIKQYIKTNTYEKNKYILGALALLLGMASCTDYTEHDPYTVTYPIPDGKSLYRPREFSGQDWRNDTFQYCYDRAAYTENLAIFGRADLVRT